MIPRTFVYAVRLIVLIQAYASPLAGVKWMTEMSPLTPDLVKGAVATILIVCLLVPTVWFLIDFNGDGG